MFIRTTYTYKFKNVKRVLNFLNSSIIHMVQEKYRKEHKITVDDKIP